MILSFHDSVCEENGSHFASVFNRTKQNKSKKLEAMKRESGSDICIPACCGQECPRAGLHPHPGGMFDNSPTFQRWVSSSTPPKSRRDGRGFHPSAVPSGLISPYAAAPNAEALGYSRMFLRNKVLPTFTTRVPGSDPSDIGHGWFSARPATGASGFSLVEILCAVLVLGVALTGLVQGVTTALRSSKESELQTVAALFAAGQVETLRAEGELRDGTKEGDCGEGLALYRWQQTITAAGIDGLHEVAVVVEHSKSGKSIYELRTLLFEVPNDSRTSSSSTRRDAGSQRRRNRSR